MDKYTIDLDKLLNDFEYSELTENYASVSHPVNNYNEKKETLPETTYPKQKHSINNVFHSLNEYLNSDIKNYERITDINEIETNIPSYVSAPQNSIQDIFKKVENTEKPLNFGKPSTSFTENVLQPTSKHYENFDLSTKSAQSTNLISQNETEKENVDSENSEESVFALIKLPITNYTNISEVPIAPVQDTAINTYFDTVDPKSCQKNTEYETGNTQNSDSDEPVFEIVELTQKNTNIIQNMYSNVLLPVKNTNLTQDSPPKNTNLYQNTEKLENVYTNMDVPLKNTNLLSYTNTDIPKNLNTSLQDKIINTDTSGAETILNTDKTEKNSNINLIENDLKILTINDVENELKTIEICTSVNPETEPVVADYNKNELLPDETYSDDEVPVSEVIKNDLTKNTNEIKDTVNEKLKIGFEDIDISDTEMEDELAQLEEEYNKKVENLEKELVVSVENLKIDDKEENVDDDLTKNKSETMEDAQNVNNVDINVNMENEENEAADEKRENFALLRPNSLDLNSETSENSPINLIGKLIFL